MTQASDLNTYDPDAAQAAEEARLAHAANTEAAMREAGAVVEEKVVTANYWGYTRTEKYMLPDGVQYIGFRPMTEGDRQKYQNLTRTTMSMNRASGDSRLTIDPSKARSALLEVSVAAVKDWYMIGPDGRPADFTSRQYGWNAWLMQADPLLVEGLEKAIQKANPWLQAEMDEEEIKKQIEELQERLESMRESKLGE